MSDMLSNVNPDVLVCASMKEAYCLAAYVALHHGKSGVDESVARMWLEEVDSSVRMGEALRAVRVFYSGLGEDSRFVRCRPCDVNRLVRKARLEGLPSDARFAELAVERGFVLGVDVWRLRRLTVGLMAEGVSCDVALERAFAQLKNASMRV